MPELVIRDDRDGWTLLTLNRPDKLNALTVDLFRELRGHVTDLRSDPSSRCVVLRGAGRCFSAGHDLADIASGEDVPSRGWHSETLRMLEKLPQPVVAAVHGHCYTGALEVALAADFILAADDARFGDTHAKWALTPVWGMSQRLPRRVGLATAKRLMFTADMIDAAEAVRIGLAEYSVPADALRRRDRGAGAAHHRQLGVLPRGLQAAARRHRQRPARRRPAVGGHGERGRRPRHARADRRLQQPEEVARRGPEHRTRAGGLPRGGRGVPRHRADRRHPRGRPQADQRLLPVRRGDGLAQDPAREGLGRAGLAGRARRHRLVGRAALRLRRGALPSATCRRCCRTA